MDEKLDEKFVVTPWEVAGKVDYERLMNEFGISPMPQLPEQFQKNILFRRGIVYGHRDFDKTLEAIKHRKKFVMMTGLMPSGRFHFGHAMLVRQILFYQSLGARIYVAVADIEAYNTRNANTKELHKSAIEEYLTNYIALGLIPENCDFYFQSSRSGDGKKSNAYYSLAQMASRHATFNEVKAIYGEISPAKLSSALLQTADMLHPQLPEFEGTTHVLVPVGSDQDPHIKLARDIAQRMKLHKLLQISSTYHQFLPGLRGGKMSSSDATSYVALTDSPEEAAGKIRKYAFSGGRSTVEEHRKLGGNPEIDVSYQWLRMFFEEDDRKLMQIRDDYMSGKLLTGELKQILIEKLTNFLKEHQKKREKAKRQIGRFVAGD